jgi:hypothetical protein
MLSTRLKKAKREEEKKKKKKKDGRFLHFVLPMASMKVSRRGLSLEYLH